MKMNCPALIRITLGLLIFWPGGATTEDSYPGLVYSSQQGGPHFHSPRQTFRIKVGQDVTFPCYVNNRGTDVITWKNGVRLLTAGPIKVYNEDRLVHRYNGSEITLRDVQPRDEGEYSCQLNSIQTPIELSHSLEVLIPPRVVAREPEVSVRAGAGAELECVAHGNPAPSIRWRRLREDQVPGAVVGEGSRLVLGGVGRGEGGLYQCQASNGVEEEGELISADIRLTVHYPPEVEVLESRREYHPKLKQRQLSVGCNVSADPSPDVNWMRGRLVLSTHDTKNKYQMSSFPLTDDRRTRQFVLTIRNIREEDYGNYTCVATNSLGAARREVTVSGRPLPPSLVPGARGNTRTEYIVRWRVNSAFPVREHNIYYERISGNKFPEVCDSGVNCRQLNCKMTDSCSMINLRVEPSYHQPGWRRSMEELQRVLDTQREAEQALYGLEADSVYLVKVQTINEFGASKWSEEWQFDTFEAKTQKPGIFSAFSSADSFGNIAVLRWLMLLKMWTSFV